MNISSANEECKETLKHTAEDTNETSPVTKENSKNQKSTHGKRKNFLGEVDILHDSVIKSLVMLVIPMIMTNLIQRIYVATDIMVLGRFASGSAVAAIGAPGSIWGLIAGIASNIGVGVDVMVSRSVGEGNRERIKNVIRTAFSLGLILSASVGIAAAILARPLLEFTGCPADIIDNATLYMQICTAMLPASVTYVFMSSVLRATGDMKRLFIYPMASGLINVVLNVIFVLVLPNPVAAVAIASVISPWVSSIMLMSRLRKLEAPYGFTFKNMEFKGEIASKIFKYGIPAAISGSILSIVGVQSQSVLNGFGTAAVAANTSSGEIINFVAMFTAAFTSASAVFMGQNIGANNRARALEFYKKTAIIGTLVSLFVALPMLIFGRELIGLIIPGEYESIEIGYMKMWYVIAPPIAALQGFRAVNNGVLQGYGATRLQMANSLIGNCGLQIIWLSFIFPYNPTLDMLFAFTPIALVLTSLSSTVMVLIHNRKLKRGDLFEL